MTANEENTEATDDGRPGTGIGSSEQVLPARAAVRAAIEHAMRVEALDSETAARLTGELGGPTDVFALDEWVAATPALSVQFCRFPGCFETPRPAAGPGKPPAYCDTVLDERGAPAHTAVRSMRMRHRLRSGGPRTATAPIPGDQSNERPLSRARYTIPDLVDRVARVVTEQQAVTSRALADLQSIVALLGDDEARAAEIESLQHDTNRLVEEAKGETLAAEKAARAARATAEQARTAETEAIAAAEEALARAEHIETDATERVAAAEQHAQDQADAADERVRTAEQRQQDQAQADQARVDVAELAAQDAHAELERVRTDAANRITAATAAAEEHKRLADAEAAAQVQAAHQQAQQVQAEADQRVRDADRATSRAEQAAEDARADRDRQVDQVTRVQDELTQARERLDATEQRHRAERDHQAEQLREATEQATAARVELATATAQLDTERAAHQREQQAATERLNEARAQAREDAEQRVTELRSTYETRLADQHARHTGEVEQLRHQPTEATTQTTTRRRRSGKEDDQ